MKELLEKKLESIPVPEELHTVCARSISGCDSGRLKRIIAAAAAVICVCVLPVIASGVYGYYEEIRKGTAITGGRMVGADNDFTVSACRREGEETLYVCVEVLNTEEVSYRYQERIMLESAEITDASGNSICRLKDLEGYPVDGIFVAEVTGISLEKGAYTLTVTGMQGMSKADPPLEIQGSWQCSFEAD